MARLCARSGPSRTRLENGRCEPVGVDASEALDNVVFIDEEDSEHERTLLARGRIRPGGSRNYWPLDAGHAGCPDANGARPRLLGPADVCGAGVRTMARPV